jgi:hypothetical protein
MIIISNWRIGFYHLSIPHDLRTCGFILSRAYLQAGITVWLDVPIEDLAKRVTAVGTESRPLLGGECGAYDQAFSRLSRLMVDRGPHYKQANCRLSLQGMLFSSCLTLFLDLTAWLSPVVHGIIFVSKCNSLQEGVTGPSIKRRIVELLSVRSFAFHLFKIVFLRPTMVHWFSTQLLSSKVLAEKSQQR